MEFIIKSIQKALELILIIGLPIILYAIPIYIIYRLVKRLIRYNAEQNDRYTRYREAEKDLNDLEDDLNNHKDWEP